MNTLTITLIPLAAAGLIFTPAGLYAQTPKPSMHTTIETPGPLNSSTSMNKSTQTQTAPSQTQTPGIPMTKDLLETPDPVNILNQPTNSISGSMGRGTNDGTGMGSGPGAKSGGSR